VAVIISYGPLEWLLRGFTNLRLSPLQRRQTPGH